MCMERKQTHEAINTILKIVGLSSIFAVSLVAPNALQLIKLFDKDKPPEQSLNRLLREMKRQKLVEFHDDSVKGRQIRLTPKGKKRLRRVELNELTIPRQIPWDKHWRMVIFDIPRSHQAKRFILLSHLRQLGFYQIKQSVWAHPFPCEKEVQYLLHELELSEFCFVATASLAPEVHKKLHSTLKFLF